MNLPDLKPPEYLIVAGGITMFVGAIVTAIGLHGLMIWNFFHRS